jgi:hypothetical protein
MDCGDCNNWKCEELAFNELLVRWEESIGEEITPGFIQRYERVAEIQCVALEDVRIGFKYCSEGILTRFYLRKGDSDNKPVKAVENCSKFSKADKGMEFISGSPIWSICTKETHGLSEVSGITFVPGLYEDNTYMRIPLYGSVRPKIVRGDAECSVCGKRAKRSLSIRVEKSFCCNKHYLQWWGKRYREEYHNLNQ